MLLFYTKSRTFTWNTPRDPHSAKYVADKYRFDGGDGRLSMLDNMTSLNPRPNMMYDWKGFPFPPKGWRYSKETMARLDSEGRIWYPIKKDGSLDTEKRPRLKRYLDEMSGGGVMGNVWTDIPPINSQAQERLGYPTQKPLALLERTIAASSNEGDVVLDPFRGCWTAVHAAQKLNRQWIGIDITHLAIGLIERRLIDAFPGFQFEVFGVPKDFNGAVDVAKRDKFQFQWWAVTLINAVPMAGKMKGADSGIDGYYYCKPDGKKTEAGIVSVKGGETVHRNDVGELRGVVEREKAPLGVLISLREPTSPMKAEAAVGGLFRDAVRALSSTPDCVIRDAVSYEGRSRRISAPARRGEHAAQKVLFLTVAKVKYFI